MNELVARLTELTAITTDELWLGFLVFLRIGAMMALLPAFGEQSVPARVRLILALAFTAVVTPAVSGGLPGQQIGFLRPTATETLIGLAFGFGFRLFVLVLQMAGAIIAQATSLSQLFGGATPEPQPAIANLLHMAGLALAVEAGLHVKAATLLIQSYQLLPAGQMPLPSDMADWGLYRIAQAFTLAFALAAPFVIASVIYNVALGLINRAMPQLMVSLVGAPALTAGGLVMLAIVVPAGLAYWLGAFDVFLGNPFEVPG